MSDKTDVRLSIVSHTNIGKTTLARTLLRRDVGEVMDRDHVTLEASEYVMLASPSARLVIWDTPGFGGTHAAALLKRLRREGTAAGWIMNEVVDRFANRSLYSSLQALRNLRASADAALYMVDARDPPRRAAGAGYVRPELELIQELGVPVIIVINQLEEPPEGSDYHVYIGGIEAEWRDAFGDMSVVRRVMVLDAFSRSWMQELQVLDALRETLPEEKASLLAQLRDQYEQRQKETDRRCATAAAEVLIFAARQQAYERERMSDRQVFAELYSGLQDRLDEYVGTLMNEFSLEAGNHPTLEADLAQVEGLARKRLKESTVGWLSAAVTGAVSGLGADAVSGGLTFGGGALLGFILGGIGGFAAARGVNMLIREGGVCRWSGEFLTGLFRQLLFYYLLVAHHGRGKGLIDFSERVRRWNAVLDKETADRAGRVKSMLSGYVVSASQPDQVRSHLAEELHIALQSALAQLYPEA